MFNALVKETEGDSLKLSPAKLDATRINPLQLLNNMDVKVKEVLVNEKKLKSVLMGKS